MNTKQKFNQKQAETKTSDFLKNEEEIKEYDDFFEMGLKENILRGIHAYGWERPSKIQSRAIVPILNKEKRDVIAQSQSGTGKTGTFLIAALEKIEEEKEGVQVVIISHTLELATQIKSICEKLAKYTKIKVIECVKGKNISESKEELSEKKAKLVVGTPGRLIDMIGRGYLNTKDTRLLILDEADTLLSQNFKDQSKEIVQTMNQDTQICLLSATFPKEVIELTEEFMIRPIKILLKQEKITLNGIKQFYVNVMRESFKFETLCDIYKKISINQSIIYVNTKKKSEWVKKSLEEKNFTVSIIHGNLETKERDEIMNNFRNGKIRVLLSTNLLARGIDVQQVSFVINYDIPNDKESYIHRIGRSGRYGRKGIAINFVTENDEWKLKELEQYYQTQIVEMPEEIESYL